MNKDLTGLAIAVVTWCCAASVVLAEDKAPPAVQAEFSSFISKFNAALKANDPAAVASMSKLPFQGAADISDPDRFAATIYKEDFSASSRKCIRRGHAVYSLDQDKNDTFSIFCDQSIYTFTRTPKGFLFTDVDLND